MPARAVPGAPEHHLGENITEPMEYYKLLGVGVDATAEELRAAFRREAKRVHPDAHPHLAGEARLAQQRRFILLAQAYETLRDPARRRAYDARFVRRPRPAAARPAASGTRPRAAASGRPRPAAAPPPGAGDTGMEELLGELERRLRDFGLDLRPPLEALLERLLAWARDIFRQVLEPGETPPGAEAGAEAAGRGGSRTARSKPDVEAELAALKRQVRGEGRRSTATGKAAAVEAELRRMKARRDPGP